MPRRAALQPRPRLGAVLRGAPELRTLTFPGLPLGVRVEIAPGADLTADPSTWSWVDITADVMVRDGGIVITTGRTDSSRLVDPGTLRASLRNPGGRYSRLNPMSPYFGLLSRNTPIRVVVDPGLGPSTRGEQFVTSWPPRWDPTGRDQWVPITAAGVLRRLSRGNSALDSSMSQTILQSGPVAYWPCEDAVGSTSVASGIGGPAMHVSGAVTFGASDTVTGSAALPTVGPTGRMSALVTGSSADAWDMFVAVVVPAAPAGQVVLATWRSTGTVREWRLLLNPSGDTLELAGYNAASVRVVTQTMGVDWGAGGAVPAYEDPVVIELILQQVGADVHWIVLTWVSGTSDQRDGTVTTATLGDITAVAINPYGGLDEVVVGQIGVWDFVPELAAADFGRMLAGYSKEQAVTRVLRLCAERGVPVTRTAVEAGVALRFGLPMGVQGSDAFLPLVRECEAVDGGLIYERGWGLEIQALVSRLNQSLALSLDYDQVHLADIETEDDDSHLDNSWVVTRKGGSSARASDDTSIRGEGFYPQTATINNYRDNQLPDQAHWRVHRGVTSAQRFRRLVIDLHRHPHLIGPWTTCRIGSRIQIDHPSDDLGPDPLDLIIEGISEAFTAFTWTVTLYVSPARIYEAFTIGDPRLGRLRPAASQITVGVDTDDVTLTVTGDRWTTTAARFPMDIEIGGERIRVTNIVGTGPQDFTVQRSVNGVVKSHDAGAAVRLWRPGVIALAPNALDFVDPTNP